MSWSSLIATSQKLLTNQSADADLTVAALPGVFLLQGSASPQLKATIYEPVICLILQGSKEVSFGENKKVRVEAGQSIIVSHSTPVSSRIVKGTAQTPYLAVIFTIEIAALQRLYHEINYDKTNERPIQSIMVGDIDDALADALKRYLVLSEKHEEADILAPLIRKEIYFRLLMASHGSALRQLVTQDSHAFNIMKATIYIKDNFNKTLAIPDVAKLSKMSLSSFYNHFKSITGLSPIQYQKELRLIQAQQLLKEKERTVASVAFDVGYESPTQFSREFTRRFGTTPKQIQ